jgi:hypothetical protein
MDKSLGGLFGGGAPFNALDYFNVPKSLVRGLGMCSGF